MTREASSTSVSADAVTGSAVIHCADARLARVHARGHRLQQVALGEDPDQAAEVLDDDGADVLRRHPLGDLAERVLGRDLDEVGAHDVGELRHGGDSIAGGAARCRPRNKTL